MGLSRPQLRPGRVHGSYRLEYCAYYRFHCTSFFPFPSIKWITNWLGVDDIARSLVRFIRFSIGLADGSGSFYAHRIFLCRSFSYVFFTDSDLRSEQKHLASSGFARNPCIPTTRCVFPLDIIITLTRSTVAASGKSTTSLKIWVNSGGYSLNSRDVSLLPPTD